MQILNAQATAVVLTISPALSFGVLHYTTLAACIGFRVAVVGLSWPSLACVGFRNFRVTRICCREPLLACVGIQMACVGNRRLA
jgi:hypothetical protein